MSYLTPQATYPGASGEPPSDAPLFGLAPVGVYRASPVARAAGGLLHHRFTLACALTPQGRACEPDVQAIGGLLSVALSVGSPRLGVTQQPALRSSDFPQAPILGARDHLTSSDAPDSDGVGSVSPLQYKMR